MSAAIPGGRSALARIQALQARQICSACGHKRGWHEEGGCTAPTGINSGCGCDGFAVLLSLRELSELSALLTAAGSAPVPDVNWAIKALDAAATWEPSKMRELAHTMESKYLAICEAQFLRGIAERIDAGAAVPAQAPPLVIGARTDYPLDVHTMLQDLPSGTYAGANCYETDDELVLHLWTADGRGVDVRSRKQWPKRAARPSLPVQE